MTENRTFWKTVELYLAHKTNKTSILTLIEEEQVISQNHWIVKVFQLKICLKTRNIKA